MGNTLIEDKGRTNLMKGFESYVEQNPEIGVRSGVLFENKLFRTISFKSHQQSMIVKVHLMRKQITKQELQIHSNNFSFLQQTIGNLKHPNLLPFHKMINFEQDKQAVPDSLCEKDYLAVGRQQIANTLDDRLQGNYKLPKCWQNFIAMQLFNAVHILHAAKLYHGHLKCSNVLLTSSDHLLLSDFASYKPYFIREDQLGDFRNLYQTKDQKCYIAPEKFIGPGEPLEQTIDLADLANRKLLLEKLQAMDMFSAGCVVAELFTGERVFTLEQLIQYRKGEYDPNVVIAKIENQSIKDLVSNLLQKDPSRRFTAQQAFSKYYENLNPHYELLYYISVACNVSPSFMQPDLRIGMLRKLFQIQTKHQFTHVLPLPIQKFNLTKFIQLTKETPFPIKSFNIEDQPSKFSQVFQSFETALIEEPFESLANLRRKEFRESIMDFQSSDLKEVLELKDKLSMSQVQRLRQKVSTLKREEQQQSHQRRLYQNLTVVQKEVYHQPEQLLTIWTVFNQIRNARFMQSKLCGLELIESLLATQDDETLYIFILPHVCYFLDDSEFQVQCYALRIMLNLLKSLRNPFNQPRDVQLFKLYTVEQMKKLVLSEDPNTVRLVTLLSSQIAEVLSKYQNLQQEWSKQHQGYEVTDLMFEFLSVLLKRLHENKNSENQQLQLLSIGDVLQFYEPATVSKQKHLLLLISAFNSAELKLPLLQSLFKIYFHQAQDQHNCDVLWMCVDLKTLNEMQLFHTVRFLRLVAEHRIFIPYEENRKQEKELSQEKQFLKQVAPLMLFPNLWVKNEAIGFVHALMDKYTPIEVFLYFQPILVKYLKQEISVVTKEVLGMLLEEPFNHRLWYDVQNKKLLDLHLHDKLNSRSRDIFGSYIENFLRLARDSRERDDRPEIEAYNQKVRSKATSFIQLGQKVNEFIKQAYNTGLFIILTQQDPRKLDETTYFKQKHDIELKSDFLAIKKLKFLQQYLLTYPAIEQTVVLSSTQQRNILNSSIYINSIELRTRQLQLPEERNFFRHTTQPMAPRSFRPQGTLVTTISEHKDIVSSLQSIRDGRFISGSHDGTVKVFDLKNIENDFTAGSIDTIRIGENDVFNKVTALKAIEGTDGFVVGTNTGFVALYKEKHQTGTFKKAESEVVKIESLKSEFSDQVFVYITNSGVLQVEDLRARTAMSFQVGKQRGLVTSMVQKANNLSTIIGTLNGYLMVYDIRCNLIGNVFQLANHDDKPLPIFSISNFQRMVNLDGVAATDFVALGYQSNNNEVGFWDLSLLNDSLNPAIYLSCSDKKNTILAAPRLHNLYKNEQRQFTNYSNNLYERSQYDFVGSYQQMDLLSYLKDPLTSSQRQIKEKWLKQTKNMYVNLKAVYEAKSSVTQLMTLSTKNENTIITASTDRTVQSWVLMNDSQRAGERNFEKTQEGTTTIISSPYTQQKRFLQCKSGDVYVIQDYELRGQYQVKAAEQRIEHKDCITDMILVERDSSLLITGSRDNTIKIWK